MAKPKIDSYEDLMNEKERLVNRLNTNKAVIRQSFEDIKGELNPFSGVKKNIRNATQTSTTNPVVKFAIKRVTEFLIGKVLLKRAGWLTKLVVPFMVREVATRTIGLQVDKKIANALKGSAYKLRAVKKRGISKVKKSE